MEIDFVKTHCSYCNSEFVTEKQYTENFEKFTAASKNAWVGLEDVEIAQIRDNIGNWVKTEQRSDGYESWDVYVVNKDAVYKFYAEVEAKLKEMNT